MKNYKRYGLGLIYVSLFFINSFVIGHLISLSVNSFLNGLTVEDIISLLLENEQTKVINVMYLSLVYKMMFSVYLVETIIIIILFRTKLTVKLKQLIVNLKQYLLTIAKYVGVMVSLIIAVYVILFISGVDLLEVGDNQRMINIVLLNNPNIYIFATVILLAPIIEEFIFRYGLINHLLKNINQYLQILIGAIVFTFIHIGIEQLLISPITAIQLILMYLPMSLVYNYIYVKQKNIVYPLTLHIINNIGSIIFVYIVNSI